MTTSDGRRALVVGAGIFGVTAALELRARGLDVTLLDPGPLPHPLAESTDISKVIRLDYGADDLAMALMETALDGWRQWNARWNADGGRSLFHECGVAFLTRTPMALGAVAAPDGHPLGGFEAESYQALLRRGHAPQRLGAAEIHARYPAWREGAFVDGYFNPEGGWAESGAVVATLAREAESRGVRLCRGLTCAGLLERGARVAGVVTREGATLEADHVVVAAGTWTPRLLPHLGGALRSVGQPVFHLAPRDPSPFGTARFPVFGADIAQTGYYGFPVQPNGVVKIANHGVGRDVDPGDVASTDSELGRPSASSPRRRSRRCARSCATRSRGSSTPRSWALASASTATCGTSSSSSRAIRSARASRSRRAARATRSSSRPCSAASSQTRRSASLTQPSSASRGAPSGPPRPARPRATTDNPERARARRVRSRSAVVPGAVGPAPPRLRFTAPRVASIRDSAVAGAVLERARHLSARRVARVRSHSGRADRGEPRLGRARGGRQAGQGLPRGSGRSAGDHLGQLEGLHRGPPPRRRRAPDARALRLREPRAPVEGGKRADHGRLLPRAQGDVSRTAPLRAVSRRGPHGGHRGVASRGIHPGHLREDAARRRPSRLPGRPGTLTRSRRVDVRRAQPGDGRTTRRLGKSTSARTAGIQRKYAFIAPTTPRADPSPSALASPVAFARLTGPATSARSSPVAARFKPFAAAPQTRTGPTMPDASADPTPMERRLMGGATPILPVGPGVGVRVNSPLCRFTTTRAGELADFATSPLSCGQSRMGTSLTDTMRVVVLHSRARPGRPPRPRPACSPRPRPGSRPP
ncbi:MAG: FAD-dependent oxidoreductase [Myxococcales bacterium]|nr:FAD-dependent oxidoreductase [Myxococcales bacterium]